MMTNSELIKFDYPCTTNYSLFKTLKGNRGVDLQRVEKIKKSIVQGYIKCPIVINKNFEVIDGQGRLQALKELGLPVYYIIDEEANLNDCIRMNITSTPWETTDYIYSGRDRGIKDYILLAELLDKYKIGGRLRGKRMSYKVPLDTILASAEGSVSAGNGRNGRNVLQQGLFKVRKSLDVIINELDYVASLYGIVPNSGVASKVLLFAKRQPDVDEVRLRSQIVKYQKNTEILPAYNNTDQCVVSFEAVYNRGLSRINRLDIRALYNKYIVEFGGTSGKGWVTKRNKG